MSVQQTTGAAAAWAAWAAQQQAQQAQAAGSGGIFSIPGETSGNAAAASSTPQTSGQGLLQYLLGASGSGAAGGNAPGGGDCDAAATLANAQQTSQGVVAQALESYAAQGTLPGLTAGTASATNLIA